MFTGIIEEVGQISTITKSNDRKTISILAPKIASKVSSGDSIAVDGACLTVTGTTHNTCTADAIEETLNRTIIADYQTGRRVNLETSLTLQKNISGHLVQGHVDATGTVTAMTQRNELEIAFPPDLAHFLALKGSITINGVSLTISGLEDTTFKVSLIPLTLRETNLGGLKKGARVNLEVDLIARYIERTIREKEEQSKYQFLKERNII
jgi:riboflavin synthase